MMFALINGEPKTRVNQLLFAVVGLHWKMLPISPIFVSLAPTQP